MMTPERKRAILDRLSIASDDVLMGDCWADGLTVGEVRELFHAEERITRALRRYNDGDGAEDMAYELWRNI